MREVWFFAVLPVRGVRRNGGKMDYKEAKKITDGYREICEKLTGEKEII